jgi:hypothetical protein
MSAKVPQIVYSNSWNQTGQVTNLSLFTPVAAGLFRIAVYIMGWYPSSVNVTYDDDQGSQTVNVLGGGAPSPNYGNECIIEATTSAAITLVSLGPASGSWSAYLTVEAL